MSELKVGIYSLSELITDYKKPFFIIPIYQRLYVWKDEQVNKFIDDIYNSYKDYNKNKIDEYYIGNVLFLKNNYEEKNEEYTKFNVVDGQQRFTTLFIILKNFIKNNDIQNIIKSIFYSDDSKCRLKFLAREYANIYFENNNDSFSNNEEIYTLINSFNIINNKLKELNDEDKKEFISFIINKVKFSLTIIPNNENTNINKLFEVMNSTSAQLEQHQILKAKILSKIRNNNDIYSLCAYIWDLVSIMDKSLLSNKKSLEKIINNIKLKNNFSHIVYKKINNDLWDEDEYSKDIANSEDKESEYKDSKYKNIFKYDFENENTAKKYNNNTQTNTSIKSIINFNYFLMHILRIFYLFYNKSYNIDKLIVEDKKLILIFEDILLNDCNEDDIINFFDLLLAARICFDEYIVKWQEDILTIDLEKENTSEFETLQTLLYHSQSEKRYWLTPLLYKILKLYKDANEKITDQTLYNYLLKLEHILYCGYYTKGDNEAQKTFFISLEENLVTNENIDNNNDIESRYELNDNKGTAFNHYIFYKLDFILYYYLKGKNIDIKLNIENLQKKYGQFDIKKLIDNYRIISRNSIEHVIAQNSEDTKEKIIENKDSFGNLVLISSNYNSSYGNESFEVKKQKFISKTKNNNRLDSIKSLIIYINDSLSDKQILEHQKEMIEIIKKYDVDIKNLNV